MSDFDYEVMGITPRYQEASLEDATARLTAKQQETVNLFLDGKVDALWLFGPNGTGKTYLGCALLIYALKSLRKKVYRNDVYGFVEDFTASGWKIPPQYYQADILFLEELAKDIETRVDIPLTIVERLVRWRFEHNKQTILSSNASLEGIQRRYGNSLVSLITGYCKTIQFKGVDLRLQ